MSVMAKKKSDRKVSPSKEGIGYVYLPKEEYQALRAYGETVDRSASYLTKIAVREFLTRMGVVVPKKPE